MMYYRSLEHAFETFRTYFGPVARAFQAVDAAAQESLRHDILAVFNKLNRATDGTLAVEAAYLQVIATRA